jgi:hypothetical protein
MGQQFKLQALYKPTNEILEYGPFEADLDPQALTVKVMFAQGFICGTLFERTQTPVTPDTIEFALQGVEPPGAAAVLGTLTATASASVTHADGSVD